MKTDMAPRSRRIRVMGLLALWGLAASGGSSPLGAQPAKHGPTPMAHRHAYADSAAVNNTRNVPVTVYLERGQFDVRMGTIPAHTQTTLALPGSVTENEPIRVLVHPQGGLDLTTPDLTIKHGKNLEILVPTNDEGFLPAPLPETIPNPGTGTTTVTVENNRDRMATVYIERGAFDVRIGTVPPNQKVTLPVPESLVREQHSVQIFVQPEGGLDMASQTLDLHRGAHLLVRVPR